MYAIVETGGKQYRVEEGETLLVERLNVPAGETVTLDRVLLVVDGETVRVGTPQVPGAQVVARVLGETKGPKIRVFKYRPKKNYRRRRGHRQIYTALQIEKIEVKG